MELKVEEGDNSIVDLLMAYHENDENDQNSENSVPSRLADNDDDVKDNDNTLLYVTNEVFDKIISNANNDQENEDVYLSCEEVEMKNGRMLMMTDGNKKPKHKPKHKYKSPLEECLEYNDLTRSGLLEPKPEVLREDYFKIEEDDDKAQGRCLICDKMFDDVASYRIHYDTHHTSKDITTLWCYGCEVSFNHAKDYIKHKESEHRDGDNICIVCGALLATSRSLLVHLNTHIKKATYICNTCGRTFTNQRSRQDHVRSKHLLHRPSSFICKHCDANFQHNRSLVRHVNCVHAKQRVICPTCNKSYSSISSLYYHQRTIHEKVAFHCGYCSKAFRSVSAIKKHEIKMHHTQPDINKETPTQKVYNYNQYVTDNLESQRGNKMAIHSISCMFCKAEYHDHDSYAKHYEKFHSDEHSETCLMDASNPESGSTSKLEELFLENAARS